MAQNLSLRSASGQPFEVNEAIACMSKTLKYSIEDAGTADAIPIPGVNAKTLAKVLEWCKRHATAKAEEAKDLERFDAEFSSNLDMAMHVALTLAANFLHIDGLLDLCCKKWAKMIEDKTPEEIRKIFNLEDDLTEEEKKKIMAETVWKFE